MTTSQAILVGFAGFVAAAGISTAWAVATAFDATNSFGRLGAKIAGPLAIAFSVAAVGCIMALVFILAGKVVS